MIQKQPNLKNFIKVTEKIVPAISRGTEIEQEKVSATIFVGLVRAMIKYKVLFIILHLRSYFYLFCHNFILILLKIT